MAQRECYSECHTEALQRYPNPENTVYNVSTYKYIPMELFPYIVEFCGPTSRKSGKMVCKSCIKFAEFKMEEDISSKKRKASQSPEAGPSKKLPEPKHPTSAEIIAAIRGNALNSTEIIEILYELGKQVGLPIVQHVAEECKKSIPERISEYRSVTVEAAWECYPLGFVRFIDGIMDCDFLR
ncbi:unnamed protein product [Orchesella dallaii]|uniref:Uncharacterized protein n=1 Tax=Orchesella dallaii TaxID=48710 RepID=A0ABP1QUJ9_9HEXA